MLTSTESQPPATANAGSLPVRLWRLLMRHLGELLRFTGVGGTTYLIHLGLFNLLIVALDWSAWIANILAVAVATTLAFLGNRHWTWRDRIDRTAARRQYLLYFFFNGIGLLISTACLWANTGLAQVWPQYFDTLLAENIAANVVGVGFGTVFRFYAYRTWVFRHPGKV